MPKNTLAIAAPALTLCLIAGAWADRAAREAGDRVSEQYSQHVRQQAAALPMSIEAWLGTDAPAPPSRVKVRPPDFILSRTYHNLVTGSEADFLLVYRRDPRDLIGQWPPGGDVDRAWALQSSAPSDQQVDGLPIAANRYEFAAMRTGGATSVAVDEFFILPSGRICRDADELCISATPPSADERGAVQVQIVSHGRLSRQERDELTATFVRALRPVIEAISEGVNQ